MEFTWQTAAFLAELVLNVFGLFALFQVGYDWLHQYYCTRFKRPIDLAKDDDDDATEEFLLDDDSSETNSDISSSGEYILDPQFPTASIEILNQKFDQCQDKFDLLKDCLAKIEQRFKTDLDKLWAHTHFLEDEFMEISRIENSKCPESISSSMPDLISNSMPNLISSSDAYIQLQKHAIESLDMIQKNTSNILHVLRTECETNNLSDFSCQFDGCQINAEHKRKFVSEPSLVQTLDPPTKYAKISHDEEEDPSVGTVDYKETDKGEPVLKPFVDHKEINKDAPILSPPTDCKQADEPGPILSPPTDCKQADETNTILICADPPDDSANLKKTNKEKIPPLLLNNNSGFSFNVKWES
nr:hypothetical protein [Abalone asfa-like virus]